MPVDRGVGTMSDSLFSSLEIPVTGRAGYRLDHLEILNWGTFDKRVWRLTPGCDTALLTGDIGSGKSTLVDALTTLLLPAHRISYNKAAGAEAKERTLRSYVEGHYKSERVEATGTSRPVGLRDRRHFSVILGVFVNEGFDETVTLAQVFNQREQTGQPYRFYVAALKELSIDADFTDFGTDLNDLRRRLRASGAELFNDGEFPKYAARFRRLLGIRSEQAMELFHQTVSMKSVGNLNEFVRGHMLEPVDATERVRGIVGHFEDLTKAHDAVTRAREQLAVLEPLVGVADRYDEAIARRAASEREREAVHLFVTELRIRLLADEIGADSAVLEARAVELAAARERRADLTRARESLITERAAAGGDRVSALEREAGTARTEAEERRRRRAGFETALEQSGLPAVADEGSFAALPGRVAASREAIQAQRDGLEEQSDAVVRELGELRRLGEETRAELASLQGRASNLPSSQLAVRSELCADLGIDEDELPFAGELLDVASDHADWRGAAERVLRGFALSLLVPQDHYSEVARWVDAHRIAHRRRDGQLVGSRLVYERVTVRRIALQPSHEAGALVLADTIEVREGAFHDYLRDELVRRADHRCVDSIEQLRSERRAVTRAGQVRSGERHEKDDRFRVDDPRSWVLGWVNERKIAALTEQLLDQQRRFTVAGDRRDALRRTRAETETRWSALAALEAYGQWREVDWQEATARAEAAEAERERLLAGSSALAEIEQRLEDNAATAVELETRSELLARQVGVLGERLERAGATLRSDEQEVAGTTADALDTARESYPDLERRLGGGRPARAEDCAGAEATLTRSLTDAIERIGREQGGYGTTLLQYMGEVRRRWPEASTEMDVDLAARPAYRAFHERVATDDLPRFEDEFKRQLNTNTIRELAQFTNWLRRQSQEIDARVGRINEALGAIDYSPGRYIRLETEPTVNQEVRAFRSDLRAATDDTLAPDDDHYSEQRFLDVQRIIERFRGREGHADSDRAWTRRVTDVRNWFTFSASERERGTDVEWEHYRDSDGKSGGQKEKLAYTILAASLAYQFGLEWGAGRSRDFRFAVIDEAFGRGSDVSTRYALELFAKLGLQLLIVTPLQKVHVIEPYVRAIGFVDNPSGSGSRLQTLTIEEFRKRRADRQS